jgi:adenine phosphoribosyltransferase
MILGGSVMGDKLLAEGLIRDIPDFPKPGIIFKDITPALQNPQALAEIVDKMAEYASSRNADVIVGIESRGFVFGAPVAVKLGKGFVPVRKIGKLPHETIQCEYALEYGTSAVEIHRDAITPGQRVVIVDDLLATGGTAAASARLVEELGGQVVGFVFLIELTFLHGVEKLSGYDVRTFIKY